MTTKWSKRYAKLIGVVLFIITDPNRHLSSPFLERARCKEAKPDRSRPARRQGCGSNSQGNVHTFFFSWPIPGSTNHRSQTFQNILQSDTDTTERIWISLLHSFFFSFWADQNFPTFQENRKREVQVPKLNTICTQPLPFNFSTFGRLNQLVYGLFFSLFKIADQDPTD